MFYKDRVLEEFRSMYAQRPAQRSVLRRIFIFNAEVAEYAYKGHIASHDHSNLAQGGIEGRIPRFSVRSVKTAAAAYPTRLHYIYRGRIWSIFDLTVNVLFSSLFLEVELCSRSAEGYRCLINGIS